MLREFTPCSPTRHPPPAVAPYVSENLMRGARLVGIDGTTAVAALSDHFPLMIDVVL